MQAHASISSPGPYRSRGRLTYWPAVPEAIPAPERCLRTCAGHAAFGWGRPSVAGARCGCGRVRGAGRPARGVAGVGVAPAQVILHSPGRDGVVAVVGAADDKGAQWPELRSAGCLPARKRVSAKYPAHSRRDRPSASMHTDLQAARERGPCLAGAGSGWPGSLPPEAGASSPAGKANQSARPSLMPLSFGASVSSMWPMWPKASSIGSIRPDAV